MSPIISHPTEPASIDLPKVGTKSTEPSLMRVRPVQEVDVAVEALQHVARYDSMRLETYREKENLANRICVSSIGSTVALRFDDVGYFNRVYCADQAFFEELPEIEAFYRGGPFGCELVSPPSDESGSVSISRPGWAPAHRYAWLCHPNCTSLSSVQETPFDIRPPKPSERQQFLLAYLCAFEAQKDRIPAALRNMRHLFDRPELDFLMAWHGQTLAGIAILMRCGSTALLCAGAALPEFREMGCHAALLAARIRLASEAGCRQIYSWAELGGQSQANMEKAGLEVAGTTTTWCYSPENGE
jgi:Acetyltransferase (GNAT) domain